MPARAGGRPKGLVVRIQYSTPDGLPQALYCLRYLPALYAIIGMGNSIP
jgi:hypothetical protein